MLARERPLCADSLARRGSAVKRSEGNNAVKRKTTKSQGNKISLHHNMIMFHNFQHAECVFVLLFYCFFVFLFLFFQRGKKK